MLRLGEKIAQAVGAENQSQIAGFALFVVHHHHTDEQIVHTVVFRLGFVNGHPCGVDLTVQLRKKRLCNLDFPLGGIHIGIHNLFLCRERTSLFGHFGQSILDLLLLLLQIGDLFFVFLYGSVRQLGIRVGHGSAACQKHTHNGNASQKERHQTASLTQHTTFHTMYLLTPSDTFREKCCCPRCRPERPHRGSPQARASAAYRILPS